MVRCSLLVDLRPARLPFRLVAILTVARLADLVRPSNFGTGVLPTRTPHPVRSAVTDRWPGGIEKHLICAGSPHAQTKPCRTANAAASVRVSTSSLARMLVTWVVAVR